MANAVVVADFDFELGKAREKIDAFFREQEARVLRVGVDAAPRQQRTLSGTVVEGSDAEAVDLPQASEAKPGVDLQSEYQRVWVRSVPTSSLGGNTGGEFIAPSTNTVYGSVGHSRTTTPFGSIQDLPADQTQAIGKAIAKEIAATPDPEPAQARVRDVVSGRADAARMADYTYGRYVDEHEASGIKKPPISREEYDDPVSRRRARDDIADYRKAAKRNAGDDGPDGPTPSDVPEEQRSSLGGNTGQGRFPFALRGLRRLGGVFAGVQLVEGAANAVNERNNALAGATDPLSFDRARIENDPAFTLAKAIPVVGGAGSAIAEALSGDHAAATATLRAAAFQQAITGEDVIRGRAIQSANQGVRAAQAANGGEAAAQIQGIASDLDNANNGTTRDEFIKANGAERIKARDIAVKVREEAEAFIPGLGTIFGGSANLQKDPTTGQYVVPNGTILDPFSRRRFNEYTAAFSAAQSAQQAVDQVGGDADKFLATVRTKDVAQLKLIGNAAEDRTNTALQNVAYSGLAVQRAAAGNNFDARDAAISAQFVPQQEQADRDLAKLREARADAKNNPDQNATLDKEIGAALAAQISLRQQEGAARGENETNRVRFAIGQQGSYNATRAALGFDPRGAVRAQADADFNAAITTRVDTGNKDAQGNPIYNTVLAGADSDAYKAAANSRIAAIATSNQNYALGSLNAGIGIATDRRILADQFARNPDGADADSIEGGAIENAVGLFTSGRRGLANESLKNAQQREALGARQFGERFVADEIDPFDSARLFDPRRTIDPQSAFDKFAGDSDALGKLGAASDATFLGTANDVSGASGLSDASTTILASIATLLADVKATVDTWKN